MFISRRTALAGVVGAGAGGVVASVAADPAPAVVEPTGREPVLASALGVRGDNTTADTDRAQRVLEEAARQFRTVHFDGQHEWVFRTSLVLFGSEDRGSTVLRGEGAYSTIIRCSDSRRPVFVNDGGERDFRRLSIRGLTIRGGSRGLSIQRRGEELASLLDLDDVRFEYQKDIAVHCDQYLISSFFGNVVLYYCNRGIYCGRNVNNTLFMKPRFEGLNGRSVEFDSPGGAINGCEDVKFVSPRFEARNQEPAAGAFVIGGYRLSTLTVDGGYFEDSHRTILRERGGLGQVVFRNCHFSGQANTGRGFQPEIFESDSIVTLEGNRFVAGTDGARHMLVAGVNRGLTHRKFGCFTEFGRTLRFVGPPVSVRAGSTQLLRISWTKWSSPEERQSATMNAELKVLVLEEGETKRVGGRFTCTLVVTSGTDRALRAQVSPLVPSKAGYSIAVRDSGDEGLLIVLVASSASEWDRSVIATVDAVVSAPVEPPFMVE